MVDWGALAQGLFFKHWGEDLGQSFSAIKLSEKQRISWHHCLLANSVLKYHEFMIFWNTVFKVIKSLFSHLYGPPGASLCMPFYTQSHRFIKRCSYTKMYRGPGGCWTYIDVGEQAEKILNFNFSSANFTTLFPSDEKKILSKLSENSLKLVAYLRWRRKNKTYCCFHSFCHTENNYQTFYSNAKECFTWNFTIFWFSLVSGKGLFVLRTQMWCFGPITGQEAIIPQEPPKWPKWGNCCISVAFNWCIDQAIYGKSHQIRYKTFVSW